MPESPDYDLPTPYVVTLQVTPSEIDEYNHVNNTVYLVWLDRTAWVHSAALGMPLSRCLELDRGMAVVRSVITYLRPAVLGDTIHVATWLLPGNGKLRVARRFQVRRASDAATLVRAEIEYACIELSSGRPMRWPPAFHDCYVPLPPVTTAYSALVPL